MSLASVQTDIDSWWESNKTTVSNGVEDYYLTHPGYFQFVWSHSAPPTIRDNGQGAAQPDNLNQLLHDQDDTLLDIVGNIPPIPCRLKCDAYQNTDGPGYAITLSFVYFGDGFEYRRRVNMAGTATWWTVPWYRVDPIP